MDNYALQACQIAQKSQMNFRHGALIIRHGQVLATGYNYVTSLKPTKCESCHAEMDAIRALCVSSTGRGAGLPYCRQDRLPTTLTHANDQPWYRKEQEESTFI